MPSLASELRALCPPVPTDAPPCACVLFPALRCGCERWTDGPTDRENDEGTGALLNEAEEGLGAGRELALWIEAMIARCMSFDILTRRGTPCPLRLTDLITNIS